MFNGIKPIYLEEIAPPYLKYDYFQYAHLDSFRFQPQATGKFNLVNAWWLCEASILSYLNEDGIREKLANPNVNLPEVRFFSGESSQCYVANNEEFLILAFRGTEIQARQGETNIIKIILPILADILADFNIELVNFANSGGGGRVHKGFKRALDEVWKDLYEYLKNKEKQGRTFWFTGHSLGAALATLAAKKYGGGSFPELYTYGSPRVGDVDFGEGFALKAYRFVNYKDIVTQVPLKGRYRHVGCLKQIDSGGGIDNNSDLALAMEPGFKTRVESLLPPHTDTIHKVISKISSFFLRRVNLAGINILFPGPFLDHVPTLYSRYISKNINNSLAQPISQK
jgi:triacylglycerol lipase